ncbi:hypothetical protein MTR67_036508, partial [Solanum verrucosum]
PFKNPDWTFLIPTTQLPKRITHSSELRIAQTWWRWKDYSKGFPTISGNIRISS